MAGESVGADWVAMVFWEALVGVWDCHLAELIANDSIDRVFMTELAL